MRIYIISGEASGDLHGSNLLRELKLIKPNINVRAWGGELLQKQGAEIVKHYKDLAFMGFIEVVKNLRTIFKNIDFCKQDILQFNPDVIVLIDYPGFNLRIAEFAKSRGYKVVYYISPQVWAWKQSRVHKIRKVVDKMLCILPFEKDFYKRFNFEVEYVGHPLLDAINQFTQEQTNDRILFLNKHQLNNKPIVALLPGSRHQEINIKLEYMCLMAKHFPHYQFVIAGAPSIEKSVYQKYLSDNIKIVFNDTYQLLCFSNAALVTSGTATLETALFKVPQVVCYKGSAISYHIARQLIKVNYISLVNLIMNREVVKELIQNDLNEENLKLELGKIIEDTIERKKMIEDYNLLAEVLGGGGASKKAALEIIKMA